jgi:hypothetical protein
MRRYRLRVTKIVTHKQPQKGTRWISHKEAQKAQNKKSGFHFVLLVPFCG